MDVIGFHCITGDSVSDGASQHSQGGKDVTILFAAAGTPLACFAEGAILAASVYLVSRGVRNPLRNKKK
jgi:hypothetical protein